MKLDGTPHIALDILTGSNAEDGPLTTGLRDADPLSHLGPRDSLEVPDVPGVHRLGIRALGALEDERIMNHSM